MMAGLARAKRATLGADKNYDTRDCVVELRDLGVTPHVAQHANGRRSAIDGRTTRHPGYAVSQRIRRPNLICPGHEPRKHRPMAPSFRSLLKPTAFIRTQLVL